MNGALDVYTCGSGKIRNPRTARCVSAALPLGAAIDAAVQAALAGRVPPRPCGSAQAYDFATRGCVGDRARVQALTEVKKRGGLASAANAAAAAKNVTHAIFAGIKDRNAAANHEEAVQLLAYLQGQVRTCAAQLEAARSRERDLTRALLAESNRFVKTTAPRKAAPRKTAPKPPKTTNSKVWRP